MKKQFFRLPESMTPQARNAFLTAMMITAVHVAAGDLVAAGPVDDPLLLFSIANDPPEALFDDLDFRGSRHFVRQRRASRLE